MSKVGQNCQKKNCIFFSQVMTRIICSPLVTFIHSVLLLSQYPGTIWPVAWSGTLGEHREVGWQLREVWSRQKEVLSEVERAQLFFLFVLPSWSFLSWLVISCMHPFWFWVGPRRQHSDNEETYSNCQTVHFLEGKTPFCTVCTQWQGNTLVPGHRTHTLCM